MLNAHIVGQEGDGSVLLSWDCKDGDALVTKIGYYSSTQGKPAYQELYRHNEHADVCSATVNSSLSLLAFTTREEEKDIGEVSYVSLCAEIHPQGRAFTIELNCDRFSFRKLQFLPLGTVPKATPRQPRHSQQSQHSATPLCYTSRLLVIIPSAYIATYTFQLQQSVTVNPGSGAVTHMGTMLLDFNEDKPLVTSTPLDWYQWDPKQQWLYYARLDTSPNLLLLSCVAFTSDPFEQVLSLCLPLPYPSERYKEGRKVELSSSSSSSSWLHHPGYCAPQIDLTTPAQLLNLQVIHRKKEDHLMCVCIQHRTKDPAVLNSADHDYVPAEEEVVEYSVFMIHNGHVIHGQVPFSALPTSNLRVHFMMVGKFVAAYVPGVMLHLLNVHPQVDPCHHLVLDAGMSPPLPPPLPSAGAPPTAASWSIPVLCNVASMQSNFDSTSIVDCLSQTIYECVLCPGALLGMFKSGTSTAIRIDLLHLAIVSLRLHNLALSMVEHVCQSPVTLDTYQIFAEFILAFAYNNTLVSHVQRYITSQLPLTTTWPSYNGGVYRNEYGTTYAHLKIAQIEETFAKRLQVMVRVSEHKLESADDLLACKFAADGVEAIQDMLYFNVVTTQPRLKRIKIASLLDQHAEVTSGRAAGPAASKRPFSIRRLVGAVRNAVSIRGRPQRQSNATGLPFLEPDTDLDPMVTAATQDLKNILVKTIGSQLGAASKSVVSDQLDSFYISELERESCELLKLIWQSLGLGRDTNPLNNTLYRQATPLEHILFELLEAYHHAHLELFIPVPSGFHTLYTCLGFMCLEPVVFLQYLAHGTLLATMNFVDKAVQSSDDARLLGETLLTRRMDQLLYNVICDLPDPERNATLVKWENPEVKLMVTAAQEEGR